MENNKNEEKDKVDNVKKEKNDINKGNKKRLWIIISIVILIIISGIIIFNKILEEEYVILPFNGGKRDIIAYKPIIYLYPEDEIEISVRLGKKENITCSYPKYENEWNVIASPDGTLIDTKTGRNASSLFGTIGGNQ